MMPPGAPPFPPNSMPPPGMGPPAGGFGGGFPPFPPGGGPPSGAMPPFAPKNLAATSLQMDRGPNMDNSREDHVAVRANGADDSSSSFAPSQPVPPTIHPDRLRMMGSGTRPGSG